MNWRASTFLGRRGRATAALGRRRARRHARGGTRAAHRPRRLAVEPLEDRCLLSVALAADDPLPLAELDPPAPQRWGIPADGDLTAGTLDATPTGTSYLLHEQWGGMWSDAEKAPGNGEDDKLCWAAAASNVLAWTGWGSVEGMSTTDEMFACFQDHWTDEVGDAQYAWDWWFDGTNNKQGYSGWAQVDVPGGGFFPDEDFYDHYAGTTTWSAALGAIDTYLHEGRGVALSLAGPSNHVVTCWGLNYNPSDPSEYYGVWITDSDDDKSNPAPPDRLRYYEVGFSGSRWYLQDYFGSDSWYISKVKGLAGRPERPEIVVGDHVLLPDTPGQAIPVYVTGGQLVEGVNFYVQIDDTATQGDDPPPSPTIETVDLVTGTIFETNNTGVFDLDGSGADDAVPTWEGHETTTDPGTSVAAEGLLGTITIDTSGISTRYTWTLAMSATLNGPTDFSGLPAQIVDGTITVDNPPVAVDDTIDVAEGGTAAELSGGQTSLLWNDTDADLPDDTLTVDTEPVTAPAHGALMLGADGTFSYEHDGSENFIDSFVYRVRDADDQTSTATVTINVAAVNDPPEALDDAYAVDEDGTLEVAAPGVLENDLDAEDDPLSAVLVDQAEHGFVDLQTDGSFAYWPDWNYHGPDAFTYRAADGTSESNPATVSITVHPVIEVTGRYVFYNNSAWDGGDPAAGPSDDDAIAWDKSALLPGVDAGPDNYTSYTGGINGVMIDVDDLLDPAALDASDFEFRVGLQGDPQGWPSAPPPVSIDVRQDEGLDGADRITIIWEDYLPHADYLAPPNPDAIGKQWLQVTVLPGGHTGLPEPDVFYFGNAVGETGNTDAHAMVNTTDEIGARHNPHTALDPAAVDDLFDFNRDQLVDLTDQIIARNHKTYFLTDLELITPPAGAAAMAAAAPSAPGPASATSGTAAGVAPSAEGAERYGPDGAAAETLKGGRGGSETDCGGPASTEPGGAGAFDAPPSGGIAPPAADVAAGPAPSWGAAPRPRSAAPQRVAGGLPPSDLVAVARGAERALGGRPGSWALRPWRVPLARQPLAADSGHEPNAPRADREAPADRQSGLPRAEHDRSAGQRTHRQTMAPGDVLDQALSEAADGAALAGGLDAWLKPPALHRPAEPSDGAGRQPSVVDRVFMRLGRRTDA